ncbi:MAG: ATP-binding protein, partial [Nanoarchaeota archaeon]
MTLDQTVRHVTRDHGLNLGVVMGDLLFQDVPIGFLELLSNGYDADAQRVNITYEPESDLAVVEDEGEGMDWLGLQNFYRMGDSVKLVNPISPRGRSRIGKFGIASLVLRRLSGHYVLESFKGNEGLRVEERFTHEDKDDKPILVTSIPPKIEHGTRITIDQLRFSPVDMRFDLDLLRNRIAIEMPLSPDFTVYVNGEHVTPRSFRTAVEYLVEMDDRLVGDVKGSVYYSSRVLPEGEHGIFIKVHGRAVGGANLDLFGKGFPESLARRIYGVIHADGLSDIVGFDRSRFIEHPKVHKLSARLRDVLKEIQNDMKVDVTSQRRSKGRDDLQELLGSVGAEVGKIMGTNKNYTITFDAERAGKIAALDDEEGILYINPGSPAVRIPKVNPLGIREALLTAAQHAVAQQGIPNDRVRERYVNLAFAAHRTAATSRGARFVDLL